MTARRVHTLMKRAGAIAALWSALWSALAVPSCTPGKIVMVAPKKGDAWRMYGGGPARTNAAQGAIVPPLVRRWEYDAGAGFGPASAALAESTVFVGTLIGEVRAVDLATGKEKGIYDFGSAVFGTPVVLGARIVTGLSGDEEDIACYNLRTGVVEWKTGAGGDIESSLLMAGGRIVAAGLDGSVAAFDTAKGAEAWRFELPETPARPGIRSSPSSDGVRVFFGTDAGEVIALDLGSGEVAWKASAGGAVFASPAVAGGRVFAASLDGKLYALDAGSGSVAWTFDAGAPLYGGAAVTPGAVVAGSSGGEVFALRPSDGSVIWRTPTDGGVGAAPLVCGGVVYAGDLKENIYAFDLEGGAVTWREKLDGRVRATPVAAGGNLIVLAEDRSVICFGSAP